MRALIFLLLFGCTTWADSFLAPLPPPPYMSIAVNPIAPNLPCDQIARALSDFNTMAQANDAAVTSYLDQVTDRIHDWYNQLSPLEGRSETLPVGTFGVLADGASAMRSLNRVTAENAELLAAQLGRIQASLAACQITKAR